MRVAANDNIAPRLLTKSQAAAYCGLAPETFTVTCPVTPISLGVGVRMRRYDLHEIDKWIDGFKQGKAENKSVLQQILERKRG